MANGNYITEIKTMLAADEIDDSAALRLLLVGQVETLEIIKAQGAEQIAANAARCADIDVIKRNFAYRAGAYVEAHTKAAIIWAMLFIVISNWLLPILLNWIGAPADIINVIRNIPTPTVTP